MPTHQTSLGPVEYRREGEGPRTVLVFRGGHMSSGVRLGEDYFLDAGYTVVIVSRPGYGGTPISTGTTPERFADAVKELCDHLRITEAVTVGISAGGRTAVWLGTKHPALTQKLILQSSISFLPWPDTKTRIAAYVAFNPFTEAVTWWNIRLLLRWSPVLAVRLLISNMTTQASLKVVDS